MTECPQSLPDSVRGVGEGPQLDFRKSQRLALLPSQPRGAQPPLGWEVLEECRQRSQALEAEFGPGLMAYARPELAIPWTCKGSYNELVKVLNWINTLSDLVPGPVLG